MVIQDADNNTINDLDVPDWIKKVEEYNAKANFVSESFFILI